MFSFLKVFAIYSGSIINFCQSMVYAQSIIPQESFLSLIEWEGSTPITQKSQQRLPSTEEINIFSQKIEQLYNQHKTLKLVIGDQGNQRFTQSMMGIIFIDPLIDPKNEVDYSNSLFVKAALSDFLFFISKSETLCKSLKKKINLVFDDWEILTWESKYSYGPGIDPFSYLNFSEKIKYLIPYLMPNSRIVMSTNFFNNNHLYQLKDLWEDQEEDQLKDLGYSIKLCLDNIRKFPSLALTIQKSEPLPEWLISPRNFAINNFKVNNPCKGTLKPKEAITNNLTGIDIYDEFSKYFFADGRFGDRFITIDIAPIKKEPDGAND